MSHKDDWMEDDWMEEEGNSILNIWNDRSTQPRYFLEYLETPGYDMVIAVAKDKSSILGAAVDEERLDDERTPLEFLKSLYGNEDFTNWDNLTESEYDVYDQSTWVASFDGVEEMENKDYMKCWHDQKEDEKLCEERLDVSARDWYMNVFPTDTLGPEIDFDVTFKDILDMFDSKEGGDIYELLGVGDSIVRERCMQHLADLTRSSYDTMYDKWLQAYDKKAKAESLVRRNNPLLEWDI